MWPFKCKQCPLKDQDVDRLMARSFDLQRKLALAQHIEWREIGVFSDALNPFPPINTNLLVANKDFTYFGFIYMEDGWDYSRQINMQSNGKIWATYTNADSVHWWLNLDEIKK